ncbi:neprilysin [Rhipicephalus microplus]|uniref:neprilysin n=1 Tax=Rhipicephalus microplus TaxID=6941 RepID=UPI003F6D01B6
MAQMRQQHMLNLTWILRAAPVPRRNQTALQKVTALFCACVSLVTENRSESADLWAFLVQHGLQPAPVCGKMANSSSADPLETTVRLAVTYGLQPLVSFSSHGASGHSRYHHLDIGPDYNTWQVTRQRMIESNDLSSFVSDRISVLTPPLDKEVTLALSADVIFTESEVAVFLAQANKTLEERKQISSFWTTIRGLENYSKESLISSDRWLSAIRRGSERSAVEEDSVYARPLALSLLTRLLSDSGGVAAMRRLLWWGLVRELSPYASGRYLPSDSSALDRFCVRRVAAKLELAIRAVYLFRAVTPNVLSEAWNLTAHMRAALSRALRSSWLSGRTRSAALRKAASMEMTLGFPERFSRESQLNAFFSTLDDVRPDKSLLSWLALRHFLQERQRRTEGDKVDLAVVYAHKVNAYYLSGNRVLVPAGIIQEPVYFHGAADAYNYGSLGQAVGHEMMHAFDTGGRKLDEDGKPWSWTATANREYEERLRCIRRSHVEVEQQLLSSEPGVGQDPENLADFSGAPLAYDAFQSLPSRRRALTVAGFSSAQLFFIGHCVKWCRSLTGHRSHGYARGRSRCIVPLMHMPQFSEAFGCSESDYMNPERKCSFW